MRSRELSLLISLTLCMGCAPEVLRAGTADPGGDDDRRVDVGDDDDDDDGEGPFQCAAGDTVVRGTVTFPSGELPVAGALVYVPIGEADVPHAGECGECVDNGSLLAHAETAADGSFSLVGLPGGTTTIVVEKGRFRRVSTVEVTECEDNLLDDEDVRLPSGQDEGDVPRIAVVTGYFDRMQDVIEKLGVSDDTVTLFAGETDAFIGEGLPGTEAIGALLRSPERLATFDIVFINCGALAWDERGPGQLTTDDEVMANLRAFVEAGGRLYVTDLSYDLLEGSFPSLVDYYGAGAGLGAAPETAGAADFGDDIPSMTATVNDDGLRDWLAATGDDGDEITVRGLLRGWAMIDAVDDGLARVWVSGESPENGRPLTVTFEAGCGRALFTSYHTVEEEDVRNSDWTAQEKILAYLVLEIGVCITEPQIF